MKLSDQEKKEIAQMVADILSKPKEANHNWLSLRKDIEDWCHEQADQANDLSTRWTTLQAKVYDAIRVVISIHRISDMNDSQIVEARKVFEFIKQERKEHERAYQGNC